MLYLLYNKVNDQYGHIAGDSYIKACCQALFISVRKQDLIFRLGGDEFLLLCGDLNGQDSAEGLARRILRMIHEGALEDMGDLWPTISMGITEVREGESMELALE